MKCARLGLLRLMLNVILSIDGTPRPLLAPTYHKPRKLHLLARIH